MNLKFSQSFRFDFSEPELMVQVARARERYAMTMGLEYFIDRVKMSTYSGAGYPSGSTTPPDTRLNPEIMTTLGFIGESSSHSASCQ